MKDELRHWFGDKTYLRAANYVRSGYVHGYHYDAKERVLTGEIKGSYNNTYAAEIDFAYSSFSEPIMAVGECSCPVGTSCKHICALLLTVLKEVGEHSLRNWMFGSSNSYMREKTKPIHPFGTNQQEMNLPDHRGFASRQDKDNFDRWLNNLRSTSEEASSPNQLKGKETSPLNRGKRYLLYVLDSPRTGKISLNLFSSQALKRGGHGAVRPFRDFHRLGYDEQPPCSLEDRKLVQRLYGAGYLNPFSQTYYRYDHEFNPDLVDKAPEPLLALAESGRLAWSAQEKISILPGAPVEPKLEWYEEKGAMRCRIFGGPNDFPAYLIPTQPMLLLTRHLVSKEERGRGNHVMHLGRIQGGIPERLLKQFAEAPAIPREVLPKLQETLAPLPGIKEEFLPKIEEVRHVPPLPVLVLDGTPANNTQINTAARARLLFQYNTLRTARLSPLDTLINEEGVRYPRNYEIESLCNKLLAELMQPAYQWRNEAQYSEGDYCLGSLKKWQTVGNWLSFLQKIPVLEENGWKVEIDNNFPYDIVSVDDDDWYGEVDDSEAQEDWFGLKLGIEIGGEKLDLLPVLAKQLNQLPAPDTLSDMGDELIPVAISPQRYITIPAKRLRLILVTLLELFSDRGTGVQKSQAPILDELGKGLGLNFAGGETLQAIARKLKNFRRIKAVKPPAAFKAELRDYQTKGLAWLQFLRDMGLGGILADDMGLGKTIQALAHIQLEKERLTKGRGKNKSSSMPPCLVIAPTSLMHNWRREAERFTPELKVVVYHGHKRQIKLPEIPSADLVLTTYALIQRDFEQLSEQNWHLLILDESQAIKNPRAKASRFVRELKAEQRLCMTGTPVENNLAELWSQFDFLMPGFLGAKDRFSRFYRTPIERYGDNDRRKQLARRLAPFMLRRTKDLVIKELPPKTEILRECELTGKQRDLYETVRAAMEKKVREEIHKKGLARSQIIILDALLKMRQACCDPQLVKLSQARKVQESAKMNLLCELLDELLAEERKILIFSQFTSMLAVIEEELARRKVPYVILTGQTTDRDTPVQRFQNGEIPVFLISMKAGGSGLNLTAADTVIHYDPWWNPAVEDQATDRAYRIGQDKPVFVYKLVATGTLEEKMLSLKERKKALAQGIYSGSGQKAAGLTAKDLDVLFEPLAAS